MTASLRALSALLLYPTEEMLAALDEIAEAVRADRSLGEAEREGVEGLIDRLAGQDIYDSQEDYVGLFDRGRSFSLYLFEHVHGESRDRGQAMVDLAELYRRGGLSLAGQELPDYLPLFLEFLSTRPPAEARELLAETGAILAGLEARLERRGSPYAGIFRALRAFAGLSPASGVEAADEAEDPLALDAAWEEAPVTFGAGAALDSCPAERIAAQLRAAQRDPRPNAP
jgi:nitrate reductase delta subunit